MRVNRAGRPLEYAVHRRVRGGQAFEFERFVPARNLYLHAKIDRFDQGRGISPLASAVNDLADIKENKTYALLKSKVAQLFGLVLYRDADDSPGEVTNEGEDGDERNAYEVDFGRGPFQLDLDREDEAEFLATNVPGSTFKDFHNLVLMVALKSLDIPYSFFDEGHTNFFGSRGSWMLYDRACVDKRNDVAEMLQWWLYWRKVQWVLSGDLVLPSNMTVMDLRDEWVPIGMPWWDPAKEIRGDLMAIGAALDTPQRVCRERGRGDVRDNIDDIAKVVAYARTKGVRLSFDPGPDPVEVEVNGQAATKATDSQAE
jgi:capsid protein